MAGEPPSAGEAVREGGLGAPVAPTPATGGVPGRDSGRGILEGVPGRANDAESRLTARGGIGGAGVAVDVGCCDRVGVCGGVGTATGGGTGEEDTGGMGSSLSAAGSGAGIAGLASASAGSEAAGGDFCSVVWPSVAGLIGGGLDDTGTASVVVDSAGTGDGDVEGD